MDDDDDDSNTRASTALSAPARPARLPIARSLAEAAPGEMVFVDGRGQALTPRQIMRAKAGFWAMLVASGTSIGMLYGVLISPLGGVIAGAVVGGLTLLKLRHWPPMRTALAQIAASQWEDA